MHHSWCVGLGGKAYGQDYVQKLWELSPTTCWNNGRGSKHHDYKHICKYEARSEACDAKGRWNHWVPILGEKAMICHRVFHKYLPSCLPYVFWHACDFFKFDTTTQHLVATPTLEHQYGGSSCLSLWPMLLLTIIGTPQNPPISQNCWASRAAWFQPHANTTYNEWPSH